MPTSNDNADLRRAALEYHELPRPGKISVTPTNQLTNQRDLVLALVHQQDPALEVDGEMRADCALDSALRRSILPNSTLRGRCIS